jgi:hypothetical protein
LKQLNLGGCAVGDDGIRRIADALVGTTIMELLNIGNTNITSVGFHDITRMIKSTQLKAISFVLERQRRFQRSRRHQTLCLYTATENVKCARATGDPGIPFPSRQ